MKKVLRKPSKGKKSTVSRSRKQTRKEAKRYPAYLLGILLVTMLLSQSALMLNAQASDWQAGLAVLDISDGVTSMVSDARIVAQPTVSTIAMVNNLFERSADATTQLVDLSDTDTDPLMAVIGINNFYKVASQEMANILDLSDYTTSWQSQIAGASISK